MKRFLIEAIMFVPNLLGLFWRLLRDVRVPWQSKVGLTLGFLYILSPLDAIPDVIPFFGELDDLAIFLLLMDGMLNHLDPVAVRQSWRGAGATLAGAGRFFKMLTVMIPSGAKDTVFRKIVTPGVKPAA